MFVLLSERWDFICWTFYAWVPKRIGLNTYWWTLSYSTWKKRHEDRSIPKSFALRSWIRNHLLKIMVTNFFCKHYKYNVKFVSLESTLGFNILISVLENPNHFGEIGFTLLSLYLLTGKSAIWEKFTYWRDRHQTLTERSQVLTYIIPFWTPDSWPYSETFSIYYSNSLPKMKVLD